MYKDFFSLTNKVFGRSPDGAEAFMGSQQAKIRARLTDALSSADTVVTVTGPVGSGKTTLVEAALRAIPAKQVVARIARIKLQHDEVLELLLSELGVEHQPSGTIQRFSEFKRLLKQWQEQGTRVFIIVEDAQRIGSEAIAELETLTSVDAGGASGASIVLMGLAELNDQLNTDELTRTKQRTSLQLSLQPFNAAEVQDYLAHRFAAVGCKVAELLESDAADMIFRCTSGRPRVINKLCDAVLHAAAEEDSKTISAGLVEQVARREFAMEPTAESTVQSASPATTESLPDAPAEADIPQLIQDTLPGVEAVPERPDENVAVDLSIETVWEPPATISGHRIILPQVPEALTKSPVDPEALKELDDALRPDTHLLQVLDEPRPPSEDVAHVPLGLQDQMPEQPSPQARVAEVAEPPVSAPCAEEKATSNSAATNTDIPTLSDSMRIQPVAQAAASADTGDTQTLRKPNLEALESALATARMGPIELEAESPPDAADGIPTGKSTEKDTATIDEPDLPEITLDHCLEERRKEAEALLLEENNPSTDADDDKEAKKQEAADRAKLDKLAAELGSAKSLEEIDDVAAETLFGEEFSQMAAAVAAMAAEDSANDPDVQPELTLDDAPDEAADESVELKLDQAPTEKAEEPAVSYASIPPDDVSPGPDINASASRRFAMLKAMNELTAKAPSAVEKKPVKAESKEASTEGSKLPEKKGPQLTPIENQFGSSMTETLKALKFDRPAEVDEEDDEEKSGGFLSRFKRS